MSRRFLFVLTLTALLFAAPAVFAQDDAPPQIAAALQDLASRLNRVVTLTELDSWTYIANRYTNTNLGCPLVAGTDVVEGVTGYTFTIAIDGVTYEYRVSADSTIVIPCSQNLVDLVPQPPVDPATGDTTPVVTGEACPAGFVGLLTPRVAANSRAEIIGSAPSRLRNAPGLAGTQFDLIQPGTVIDIVGGPICADEYVWWQVSANGQGGWVAEGALPDTYFIAPVTLAATPTGVEPTALPTLTPAPVDVATATPLPQPGETVVVTTGDLPELAALVDNVTLSLFDLDAANAVRETSTVTAFDTEFGPSVFEMRWSPDGRYLVYGVRDEGDAYGVYVTDVAGSQPTLLADDVLFPMPVAFSPAGTQVYFARPSTMAMSEDGLTVNVFVRDLNTEDTAELIGTVMFGVGCGGGSPYPGDAVYNWEAGFMGRSSVFALTPYGLVYSTNCTGSGLALLDLQTGISTELGTDLSRASVSPNGERLVAVQDNFEDPVAGDVLTVVDLATLTLTPLGTFAAPDQVAWGADDVIYYSTRSEGGLAVPGSDSEVFATTLGIPEGIPSYNLSVHRVDLTQTTDAEIWVGTGWAVPRLFATPAGDALYFNVIPTGEDWVQAVNNGTVSIDDSFEAFHLPVLFRLDLASGELAQLAENLVMPTFNPAAFTAGELETVG